VSFGVYTSAQTLLPAYSSAHPPAPDGRISATLVGIGGVQPRGAVRDDVDATANARVLFTPAVTRQLLGCCGEWDPSCRGNEAAVQAQIARIVPKGLPSGPNQLWDAVTFDLRWKAACGLPVTAGARRVARDVPDAAAVVAEHCTAHDYASQASRRSCGTTSRLATRWWTPWSATRIGGSATCPRPNSTPRCPGGRGQDVEPVEGSDGSDGRWRIARRVAPDRVVSTVDPEARHAHESVHRRQDGFKAHIAIEPDTGIITDCALTKASGTAADGQAVSEASVGLDLLDGEDPPVTALADSANGCKLEEDAPGKLAVQPRLRLAAKPPLSTRRVATSGAHANAHCSEGSWSLFSRPTVWVPAGP
jgi:hypothetical protein